MSSPADHLPADLRDRFEAAARSRRLLVVSDFDGTLAPLTGDPQHPHPDKKSTAALNALSVRNDTQVALLSGRDLASLTRLSGFHPPVIHVGSHGAETEGETPALTAQQEEELRLVGEALEKAAARADGSFVEYKPLHVVIHTRKVEDPKLADEILNTAREVAHTYPDLVLTEGKCIAEIGATHTTKGSWILEHADTYQADHVMFFGDDVTDEAGFKDLLAHTEAGHSAFTTTTIKIGEGDSAAEFRLADTVALGDALTVFAALREELSQ